MTYQTSTTVTAFAPPEARDDGRREVVVRSLPKFVFLWPLFAASLVMIVITTLMPQHTVTWTLVFLALFFLNMLALAMDFPSAQFVALVCGAIMAVLAVVLIDLLWVSVLPKALALEQQLEPVANDHFFILMAVAMGIVYALVWFVDVRNCYWVIRPSEIVHHHGFFRDKAEYYPAPGNLMQKDITDMFEWLLMRSGRLVIHPQMGEDIILENVRCINDVERRIQLLVNAREGNEGGGRHPGHHGS